jgi:hypothetical protein
MGFKEVRAFTIEALRSGRVRHDRRSDADNKNLLSTRSVDAEFVANLLLRCAGWEYSTSRHHFKEVDCHIFTPMRGGERWYIKVYMEHGFAVFISVHP